MSTNSLFLTHKVMYDIVVAIKCDIGITLCGIKRDFVDIALTQVQTGSKTIAKELCPFHLKAY